MGRTLLFGETRGAKQAGRVFPALARVLRYRIFFLRRGRDVIFPKDTRIEIETAPLHARMLKPAVGAFPKMCLKNGNETRRDYPSAAKPRTCC